MLGKNIFDHIRVNLGCQSGFRLRSIEVPHPRIALPNRQSREESSHFSAACVNRRVDIRIPNDVSRVFARRINRNRVPAIALKRVHESSIE